MNDVPALTQAERDVVLAATETFAKFPRAMGVRAINAVRNRYRLIEAEDAQRAIWNYRLTPLGIRVAAALRAQS